MDCQSELIDTYSMFDDPEERLDDQEEKTTRINKKDWFECLLQSLFASVRIFDTP